MAAKFEIKEICQSWGPPFDKKIKTYDLDVEDGKSFDYFPRLQENLFKLIKTDGNKVLVHYHSQYTLKGYEQPSDHKMWIKLDEPKEFTFLWGEHGTTKKLTLKSIQNFAITSEIE